MQEGDHIQEQAVTDSYDEQKSERNAQNKEYLSPIVKWAILDHHTIKKRAHPKRLFHHANKNGTIIIVLDASKWPNMFSKHCLENTSFYQAFWDCLLRQQCVLNQLQDLLTRYRCYNREVSDSVEKNLDTRQCFQQRVWYMYIHWHCYCF